MKIAWALAIAAAGTLLGLEALADDQQCNCYTSELNCELQTYTDGGSDDTIAACRIACAASGRYSWVSCDTGVPTPATVGIWSDPDTAASYNPCGVGGTPDSPGWANCLETSNSTVWAQVTGLSFEPVRVADANRTMTDVRIWVAEASTTVALTLRSPDGPGKVDWPATETDSAESRGDREFTTRIPLTAGETFIAVETDGFGQERVLGPFVVGETYGTAGGIPRILTPWWRLNWSARMGLADYANKRLSTAAKSLDAFRLGVSWNWLWNWWLGPNWNSEALLKVSENGVTRVGYDELLEAGVDFARVPNSHLALTDGGIAQARFVTDENADGRFGPGDSLEFLAQVTPGLYTGKNTYRLQVDRRLALAAKDVRTPPPLNRFIYHYRSFSEAIAPHTERFEAQSKYHPFAQGKDPWYDHQLSARPGAPDRVERAFDLPGYSGGEVQLNVRLWGITDWPGTEPDHRVWLSLNGHPLGDVTEFNGQDEPNLLFVVPEERLRAANNTLTVGLPGDTGFDFDVQALDGFDVTYDRYTRLHEGEWRGVLKSRRPVRIGGVTGDAVAWKDGAGRLELKGSSFLPGTAQAAQWTVANARAIRGGEIHPLVPRAATPVDADYLILSHPLFLDHLGPLETLQHERGLTTHVVNVESVYAAHSDFEPDANAIRKYISESKSRYVLLVGGDTYDYHDYLGVHSKSYIPTHYVSTDPRMPYTPSDSVHGDKTGDGVPDVAVGRLPVRTVAELRLLVEKLYAYEPPDHLAFFAGQSDDAAREFSEISHALAARRPGDWTVSQIYADDEGVDAARASLLSDLNEGGTFISYHGHSSPAVWGSSRAGTLLTTSDVAALTNGNPVVITQWGCWNTYYVDPLQVSLSDAFLLGPGGAVAVLGATGLTDTRLLEKLGAAFFSHLESAQSLGEALLGALRERAAAAPEDIERLRGFALLGDPALPLGASH